MKQKKLTIQSKTAELNKVREFVSAAAQEFGFSDEEVSTIALAVDEACTNVIKHAYKYDSSRSLSITINPDKKRFEVLVTDTGLQFDPDGLQTPDMREYIAHLRKGGLGVYLMKNLMDEVEYQIEPGRKNEVRLIKYLKHRG